MPRFWHMCRPRKEREEKEERKQQREIAASGCRMRIRIAVKQDKIAIVG